MTASKNRYFLISPRAPMSISQAMPRRSTCGLSEHNTFDNTSGNIGITCCGKYTELPRLFAVDGDEFDLAQILAPADGVRFHLRRELAGLIEYRVRPGMRNIVPTNGDFDFHPGRHVIAKHFDDPSDRPAAIRRRLHQFGNNDLPVRGAAIRTRRYGHVLGETFVGGRDESHALGSDVATDDISLGTFEHFDDRAGAPITGIDTGHARQHGIAVQYATHLARR